MINFSYFEMYLTFLFGAGKAIGEVFLIIEPDLFSFLALQLFKRIIII